MGTLAEGARPGASGSCPGVESIESMNVGDNTPLIGVANTLHTRSDNWHIFIVVALSYSRSGRGRFGGGYHGDKEMTATITERTLRSEDRGKLAITAGVPFLPTRLASEGIRN